MKNILFRKPCHARFLPESERTRTSYFDASGRLENNQISSVLHFCNVSPGFQDASVLILRKIIVDLMRGNFSFNMHFNLNATYNVLEVLLPQ